MEAYAGTKVPGIFRNQELRRMTTDRNPTITKAIFWVNGSSDSWPAPTEAAYVGRGTDILTHDGTLLTTTRLRLVPDSEVIGSYIAVICCNGGTTEVSR